MDLQPVYVKLLDLKPARTIDMLAAGVVHIDITDKGEIVGVEILSTDYKITVGGQQVWPLPTALPVATVAIEQTA